MSTDYAITEDVILKRVTPKSFERGKGYYNSGMVEAVIQRGDRLFAEVLGSEIDLYHVGIALQGDDFTASCTCAYDWGGYCKHVVAVLMTFLHDRELVAVGPPVEDLLSELDVYELRALVIGMVEFDPRLSEIIDKYCQQVAPAS